MKKSDQIIKLDQDISNDGNHPSPKSTPAQVLSSQKRKNDALDDSQRKKSSKIETMSSKVPPIFVSVTKNWKQSIKSLEEALGDKTFDAKLSGANLKIMSKSPESYRNIVHYLKNQNIEFHTFNLEPTKTFKVVLKGLPADTQLDEINDDLNKRNINAEKIVQLTSKRDGCKLPIFQVTLAINDTNKEIYNIDRLCHLIIDVQAFKNPHTGLKQCHTCQRWGHSSSNCYYRPRCVKCTGDHPTKECKKQSNEPPKCINCQKSGHPANWKGCEVYLKIIERSQGPINQSRNSNSYYPHPNSPSRNVPNNRNSTPQPRPGTSFSTPDPNPGQSQSRNQYSSPKPNRISKHPVKSYREATRRLTPNHSQPRQPRQQSPKPANEIASQLALFIKNAKAFSEAVEATDINVFLDFVCAMDVDAIVQFVINFLPKINKICQALKAFYA